MHAPIHRHRRCAAPLATLAAALAATALFAATSSAIILTDKDKGLRDLMPSWRVFIDRCRKDFPEKPLPDDCNVLK